jgi:hypothetical protein
MSSERYGDSVHSEILGAASRHEGNSGSENIERLACLWPLDDTLFQEQGFEFQHVCVSNAWCAVVCVRSVCGLHACVRDKIFCTFHALSYPDEQ